MSSHCPYRLFACQRFAVSARDALKHRRKCDKHSQQLNTITQEKTGEGEKNRRGDTVISLRIMAFISSPCLVDQLLSISYLGCVIFVNLSILRKKTVNSVFIFLLQVTVFGTSALFVGSYAKRENCTCRFAIRLDGHRLSS
jgi:hypothetical protein